MDSTGAQTSSSLGIASLLPVIIFLIIAVAMAVVLRRRALKGTKGESFIEEYYIGNRSLGGFVLAMTTVATYGSVSSFVGGPGQAWSIGWGWVYMAVVQVTALFLLYGILGRKIALISRRLNAVTVIDIIRRRYNSNALAIVAAAIIVVFFATTMIAQFVGGAKLFESVTGYSYTTGLVIFGITAILFTTIGGFRGVAWSDALCGIVMLLGLVVIAGGILNAGGGYDAVMATIETNHPEMLEPFSDGNMPWTLYFTQWLLVGVFTFCLPQSMVRCIGAKSTKALSRAMIIGTIVIGFMMIVATSLGVLSAGILTEDLAAYGNSVDNIIPAAIVKSLPAWLAGIAIVGPIAASISTVSSLLIASSSTIIKDLYIAHREHYGQKTSPRGIAWGSQAITLGIGIVVFVLSLVPPSVIWKINMFAFGGLETAFVWVFVMGLFWRRATKVGALCSMIGGVGAYCLCMGFGIKVFGMHQIVIGVTAALVCMVIGSLLSKPAHDEDLVDFFPAKS